MGTVYHLEDFSEEVGPLPESAIRRTRSYSGRVRLSDSYDPGGEAITGLIAEVKTVAVVPEFDGEWFVVWDMSRTAPRLRVFDIHGEEARDGTDLSDVLRDIRVTVII